MEKLTYARDRAEWRSWLEANHETETRVRLVYYKKASGKASVTYDEAVEEALCFGWIDSKVLSLDEERYSQFYTPRKKGSIWSALNKKRVQKVIAEGRMTPAGQAKIDAAKADGSWNLLDQVDSLELPPDLLDALTDLPESRDAYEALATSRKKQVLYHLISAKRAATREKRIAQILRWLTGEDPWPGM